MVDPTATSYQIPAGDGFSVVAYDFAGNLTSFSATPVVIPGDIDGDGSVTMLDVLLAARAAVGMTTLTGSAFQAADVNHDGTITMLDVLLIARIAVGTSG
jgi:hypothetical protein